MVLNKLVKKTIYASLFIQFLTTTYSLNGLRYELNDYDSVLKEILILEAFVQFIEGFFYVWVIFALKDLNIMTPRRYIDWFITTPTMLLTTIIFMKYLDHKQNNLEKVTLEKFLISDIDNIKYIFIFNFLMLLFGYLGETNKINNNKAVIIGFIFFYLSFNKIYKEYAHKTELGTKLFIFLLIIWSLYGYAAIKDIVIKNVMYNGLDVVAKNFYGLFIYYYITQIGYLKVR